MKKFSSFFFTIILLVITLALIYFSIDLIFVNHNDLDSWRYLSTPRPWYCKFNTEDDLWLTRIAGLMMLGTGVFLGFESVIKLIKLK